MSFRMCSLTIIVGLLDMKASEYKNTPNVAKVDVLKESDSMCEGAYCL